MLNKDKQEIMKKTSLYNKSTDEQKFYIDIKTGIFGFTSLHLRIIKGLLSCENYANEGWQPLKSIVHNGEFKSQVTNFPNYTKPFIKGGILEVRTGKPQKRQKIGLKEYRLKPTIHTISCLFALKKVLEQKRKKDKHFKFVNEKYMGSLENYARIWISNVLTKEEKIIATNHEKFLEDMSKIWELVDLKSRKYMLFKELDSVETDIKRIEQKIGGKQRI